MGRILGFVGWPCAGKDEAAEYLQRGYSARRFGHSDFIRRIAATRGITLLTTGQLSEIFEANAAMSGYGWIAQIVSERIQEIFLNQPRTLVVVSGVRNLAEVDVYNKLPGFQLVKLEADFNIRLARARKRQRIGERGLTRDGFREIEQLHGNANIPDLMKLPGPVIVNSGTSKYEFHRSLDKLVRGTMPLNI